MSLLDSMRIGADAAVKEPETAVTKNLTMLTAEELGLSEKNEDAAAPVDLDVDALTSDGVAFTDEKTDVAEEESDVADAMPSENKVKVALKVLRSVEQQVQNAIRLLEDGKGADKAILALGGVIPAPKGSFEMPMPASEAVDGRIVEGVFDGQAMVGSDGKSYSVPPNYASKSKLVEGDMLKLTITPRGSFIYKQIGPIERTRMMGVLGYDQTVGQYYAATDDKRWNVIRASVTYFKGEVGDEVVLLVPKDAPSKWAAVENIIKKNPV